MNEPNSEDDLFKNTLLYQEAQAEREEILRHKWFESEKKGYDIGLEQAQLDWKMKHRSRWQKDRKQNRRA